jgi:hypothetical protein
MRFGLFLAAFAATLPGCQTSNQQAVRPGFDQYGVQKFNGKVTMKTETIDETQNSLNGTLNHKELRTREEIALAFLGFYYHPKFMEFDFRGTYGLEQRDISTNGALKSNQVDGQNLSYDLRLRILKDLDYSGEIYARRSENVTRQAFFESSEAIIAETGANLRAKEWYIPTIFNINHYSYEGRGLNEYSEARDTIRVEGRRDDEDVHYQYLTEYNDARLGNYGYRYQDLNLNGSATHYLGDSNQNRLFNGAYYRQQKGSNENSNLNWNSSYRHQWLDSLFSQHDLQYTSFKRGTNTTDTLSLSSGINHQLFQSLASSFAVRWSDSKFGEGNLSAWGARAGLNYRKKIPIGNISIGQTYDLYMQDRGALQGIANVVDEIHTNVAGVPIFLQNLVVDSLSVVVTDSSGLRIYQPGLDYFVIVLGARTRVDIPVSSQINPGQSLLIDYSYQPTPEQKVRTDTVSTVGTLSVRDTADFSLGYSSVGQLLLSGFDDGTLEESKRIFANARYYPVSSTVLGAEYEDYQSNLIPFTRTRVYGDYSTLINEAYTWQTTASFYRIDFPGDPRTEYGGSISASMIAYLDWTSQANLRAEVHRDRFRTDDGKGYLLEVGYQKTFRKISYSLTGRFLDETFDIADDQRLITVQFIISRRF